MATTIPVAPARASVKDIKDYFGELPPFPGKPSWVRELKDLKDTPSAGGHATGYDDVAVGLADGTLTY